MSLDSISSRESEMSAEEKEMGSLLEGTLRESLINEVRENPVQKDWTPERIIFESLLAKLVESGPEMAPITRTRLRNLIHGFGVVALPNMHLDEKDFFERLS